MKTTLVQIGNSRGIRIPKAFLEQCQFRDEVDLEIRDDGLFIRCAVEPRSSWEDAFRRMREHGDDVLVTSLGSPMRTDLFLSCLYGSERKMTATGD